MLRAPLSLLFVMVVSSGTAASDETLLWRVGLPDNASTEFTGEANPAEYAIPADWKERTTWPDFRAQTTGTVGSWIPTDTFDTVVRFSLPASAKFGCEFRMKTVNASSFVTEVAVFANGFPCGILQFVGTEGWLGEEAQGRRFGMTAGIYVPPEFLVAGANELRIRKLGHPYNRDNGGYLSLTLDWFAFVALGAPAKEPLHSRYIRMGMSSGQFAHDERTCATEPLAWQWMGYAWSGNPTRAAFWHNTEHLWPKATEYLEACRAHNLSVILNHLHGMPKSRTGKPDHALSDGSLDPYWQGELKKAFDRWGGLAQWYEVTNEPCMNISDVPLASSLALAKFAQAIKPRHLKIAAPAWTYGGGKGFPIDWDVDVQNRLAVEAYCDSTNGHAYGNSYVGARGSLLSTINSFGQAGVIENGFPREFVNTETGTHITVHHDFDNLGCTGQINASQHDRTLRAHIGFCDVFVSFALFPLGDVDFRTIDGDPYAPGTWLATEFRAPERYAAIAAKQDDRVAVFRRLALAYASHGRPLPYRYTDPTAVKDKLVYVRAVDTAGLPPLLGSGATANKILVSLVNFSREPQAVAARVTLPNQGVYAGLRFGAEPQFLAARSQVRLIAAPDADFTEMLGPGEAVQYALEFDARLSDNDVPPRPAPILLDKVEGGKVGEIGFARLTWTPPAKAEGMTVRVQRSEDGERWFEVGAASASAGGFEDARKSGPDRGREYQYRLRPAIASGDGSSSPPVRVRIP